jgi:TetR/AcrR family transcriptional regulator, transcriptional repressor for nem operon
MMAIMRYPDGHKQAVRERVVAAAAGVLRQRGLAGAGIPALMRRAGLTHGGFYAHFDSRDALVAEAIRAAARETADGVFAPGRTLAQVADHYLSPAHVAHPEHGCVLAALGTDGPRQPARARRAFAEVARGFLRLTERALHPGSRAEAPSDDALVGAATMVGAVVLARLIRDAALSARLLAAARRAVTR